MSNQKSNKLGIISMSLATIAGALILIFFPNLISGVWKILAWSAMATGATTVGVLQHIEKKKIELIEEIELARIRRKRQAQREKDRAEQAERVQKAQARAEQKEVKRTAKQLEIKAGMVKQSETVWAEKEQYALDQEILVREIIEGTNDMDIRTAAGFVAVEWNEAALLARWTAKELIMFSRRPEVTTEARDEAQAAIIEAAGIKASGNSLTEKQGQDLKKKKDKALQETYVEEDRLDDIRNVIENAELKWKVAESRANRGKKELKVLMKD